jgi:hypothetical protein
VPFDWPKFLRSRQIEFVTHGPNVGGKDQIAIHCPFCGDADPSQHLSISLKGRGWRCWRNPRQHKGTKAARLIQALLRCSWEMACELAGENSAPLVADEDIAAQVAVNLGVTGTQQSRPPRAVLPPEFKPINKSSVFGCAYWNYVRSRGYTDAETNWVVRQYGLHYALKPSPTPVGDFSRRVIIPVYSDRRELITWTGRCLQKDGIPRYKTMPTGLGPRPISDCLLGLPILWSAPNPRTLVICEGPFDAITVTVLGHQQGVYGTCLFGLNVSEAQADLLEQLEQRFERQVLLVDPDAALLVLDLMQGLSRRVRPMSVPPPWEDPGDLCKGKSGREFVASLAA